MLSSELEMNTNNLDIPLETYLANGRGKGRGGKLKSSGHFLDIEPATHYAGSTVHQTCNM